MSPSGYFPEEKRRQQAKSGKLVRILSCPSVPLPFSPSLTLSFLKLPILQTWFQESKTLPGMISRNPTHSAWAEFQHWSHSTFMVTNAGSDVAPTAVGRGYATEHWAQNINIPLWSFWFHYESVHVLLSPSWWVKKFFCSVAWPHLALVSSLQTCVSCCNQGEIKIKQVCKDGCSSFYFFFLFKSCEQ